MGRNYVNGIVVLGEQEGDTDLSQYTGFSSAEPARMTVVYKLSRQSILQPVGVRLASDTFTVFIRRDHLHSPESGPGHAGCERDRYVDRIWGRRHAIGGGMTGYRAITCSHRLINSSPRTALAKWKQTRIILPMCLECALKMRAKVSLSKGKSKTNAKDDSRRPRRFLSCT